MDDDWDPVEAVELRLSVNSIAHNVAVDPSESLLFALREGLGLYGTKNACEQGECGSCSVFLDDELVCSCLVAAVDADGSEVITIEGVTPEEGLSDAQRCLVDSGAVQCGFCTPGFVMSLEHLVRRGQPLDDAGLREFLAGTLCRCTGYGRILAGARRLLDERGLMAEGPPVFDPPPGEHHEFD